DRSVRPWLTIVGVGEDGVSGLPPHLHSLVENATSVIGPARFNVTPPYQPWRSVRLADMIAQIEACRGTPTVLLASGDPLGFGIGATLSKHLAPGEFTVVPHASSFQLAAAAMRWPLQHVTTLALHARPVETLHSHVVPG